MQAEVLEGTAKISLVSDSVLNFVIHALHVGAALASRACFVYVCGLIIIRGGIYSPSFLAVQVMWYSRRGTRVVVLSRMHTVCCTPPCLLSLALSWAL